jgi:outer membrane protein TolC
MSVRGLRPVTLAVLLAGGSTARAEPRALRLEEAVTLAARENPALAATGAEVRVAAAGIESARGLDDLVLDATASYLQTRRELVAGTPVDRPAFDDVAGSIGLVKPLPTGGRLGLRLLGDYNRTRFATEMDAMTARPPIDVYSPSLQLTFAHSLLRGRGVAVARADRQRARVRTDIASLQREATASALVREVVAAYWDLAYATQELQIRRDNAASAREQLRRVQANIEVGKQPRSASAEIDVTIALRDESVLFAEQALLDRALELRRLCGLPVEAAGATALVAADAPGAPDGVPDPATALTTALARNPQLQTVRAQGRAAAIEIEVTENGLLPLLDFAVSGGPGGNARDTTGAWQQLTGLGSYTVTAGLVFQQPIGRHAARGAAAAARETLHKVRFTEADLSRQIAAAVVRTVAAVDTARRRALVLARSTEAAALDLEAERARFEVGRSTNFDVLRRQQNLAEVQLVHLRARVDYLKALASAESLTGEILDRHGVRLRGAGAAGAP